MMILDCYVMNYRFKVKFSTFYMKVSSSYMTVG